MATIQDDSLRAKQQISMLFAISEGTIEEINNIFASEVSLKSHYIDFAYTKGEHWQPKIPGFDHIGNDIIDRGELLTDGGTGGIPMILTFTDEEEFVVVTVNLPDGLYWHSAKGSLRKTSVNINVYTSPSASGAFTKLTLVPDPGTPGISYHKNGKSMSPYLYSFRVARPSNIGAEDFWRIKLERTHMNPPSEGAGDASWFKNRTTITTQSYQDTDQTNYGGTALLALRVEDASQVGNQVPHISASGKGLRLYIPDNYNPVTHTRTGTWGGSFVYSDNAVNNLSWVIYNLLSNKLDKEIPTNIVSNGGRFNSITRSGSVATVSNENHGFKEGDRCYVTHPTNTGYNGIHTVTNVIDWQTFQFNVSGTPANITSKATIRQVEKVYIGAGYTDDMLAKYTFEKFAQECDSIVKTYTNVGNSSNIFLTRVGSTAHLKIPKHSFQDGDQIFIANASDNNYNGQFTVTVVDANNITYPLGTSSPVTPAKGHYLAYSIASERKYTFNGQIIEIKDGESFFNDLLSVGNAQFTEINGLLSITWDRALGEGEINATPILTNDNAVDGVFEYSGGHISEFYTQVNVTIQDKDNFNKTKTIVIQSKSLVNFLNANSLLPEGETTYTAGNLPVNYFVDKYGYNVKDIVFPGVFSDTVAIRKAKGILWDTLMNNTLISFKTLIEGASFYRGQVIRIADATDNNIQASGRIVSWTHSSGLLTLNLDREITLTGITTIELYIQDTNLIQTDLNDTSTFQRLPLKRYTLNQTSGIVTTVTIDTNDLPIDDSIYVIQYPTLTKLYTVASSSKEDDLYVTTGLKFDNNKFTFIDSDFLPPNQRHVKVTKFVNNPVVITPDDITVTNRDAFNANAIITLVWLHDDSDIKAAGKKADYVVNWEADSGQSGRFTVNVKHANFIFSIPTNEDDIVFTFSIFVRSDLGFPSFPVTVEKTYLVQNNILTDEVGMIEA